MISTFGHQTVEKTTESIGDRLKFGPVLSTVLDEEGNPKEKPPFAGDGYYFWEDNIEAAEWWGKVHYQKHGKQFRIFRVDMFLRYDDGTFFDLVGRRQHLKLLGQLIKKAKMAADCEGWVLHNYIAYFRLLEAKVRGIFPFRMVRFNDSTLNPKIQQPIALSKGQHETMMNPFYIICVFDMKDISLNTMKFVK